MSATPSSGRPESSPHDLHRHVVGACKPYLVASTIGTIAAETIPIPDLGVGAPRRYDPFRIDSAPFLALLQRLESHASTPYGTTMPRWALYDCGEVPGAIVGFALPAGSLPSSLRRDLRIEADYRDLVPLSMVVFIPMLEPGTWHSFALCGVTVSDEDDFSLELLTTTFVLGLTVVGARTVYATSMGQLATLCVHTRFAPLQLLTAWTPAHTHPDSFTYRFDVTRESAMRALGRVMPAAEPRACDHWVDCDHADSLRELQEAIESGRRYEIIGPPRSESTATRLPLREVMT